MATDPAIATEIPVEAMSDDELASHLQGHEANALGYHEDQIADEQAMALDYYYRRMPDVKAAENCSSVVDGTVGIVVDNALASILKPFVSSDETVSFAPRGPDDVKVAEQATEYCNYVFNYDNAGFVILHNWFKDALLTKIGIVKCWWEERERIEREQAVVTNEIALAQARMREDYVGEEEQADGTVLVSFASRVSDGRVRVENIPPEEWFINPFARTIHDASYIAHVPKNVTRSDMIEMGFDAEMVAALPGSTARYFNSVGESERRQARYFDESYGASDRVLGTPHESQELIDLRDEYVRIDFDGDGIAELRRVVRSGDKILLNEEIEYIPFAVLCPVPMPHKVIGLSVADQVVDLQRINTVIWRQTLDNLYKTNNPRPLVGEGAQRDDGTTEDSLGDNAPGAAVLLKDRSQFDFGTVPFFAKESFGMLEYVEGQQEARTGIGRMGQGLDADALKQNKTATEISMISSGRNARAEMIARIFAETGVKDLFKLMLRLLVENQDKPRMIRLRREWVEMNPDGWPVDMDVEISVGLGMGDRMEQLAVADSMLADMAQVAQSPYASLIDATKVYNALKKKYNAGGIKNVDDFLNEPQEGGPQQEEKPDPEMAKVEAEAQMQAAKLQGEQQLAAMKIEAMREEAAAKQQLAREQAQFEAQLAREKAVLEIELARDRMEMESTLARERAQIDAHTKVAVSKNRPGGDLDK